LRSFGAHAQFEPEESLKLRILGHNCFPNTTQLFRLTRLINNDNFRMKSKAPEVQLIEKPTLDLLERKIKWIFKNDIL
jgi:hypothetical protein